MNNKGVILV